MLLLGSKANEIINSYIHCFTYLHHITHLLRYITKTKSTLDRLSYAFSRYGFSQFE